MHFFRLALSSDAEDNTGTINLTAFNDNVARLFQRTISELYAPDTSVSYCVNPSNITNSTVSMSYLFIQQEQITSFEETAEVLRTTPIYIERGPTTALAKKGNLKWVLKSISLKQVTIQEAKNKEILLPNNPSTGVVLSTGKEEQLCTPHQKKVKVLIWYPLQLRKGIPPNSELSTSESVLPAQSKK